MWRLAALLGLRRKSKEPAGRRRYELQLRKPRWRDEGAAEKGVVWQKLRSGLPYGTTARARGCERVRGVGIVQRDEVEAFGRDGSAGARAIAKFEYLRDVVWREAAFADVN